MRRIVEWFRGPRQPAPSPEPAPPATAPGASAESVLATMTEALTSAGFRAWREDTGLSSIFAIRGARRPDDAADVAGVVCDLHVTVDEEAGAVSCRCLLPDAVPVARRAAVADAAMRRDTAAMFGSWDLDPDTGALSLRIWTHLDDGTISPWAARGLLGQIFQGSETSAAALCALAYHDAPAPAEGGIA